MAFTYRHPRDRPFIRHLVAGIAGLFLFALARDSRALGPVDVEVAAKGGFGVSSFPPDGPNSTNALGYGGGGRVGATLHGLYAGISVVDYAGETVILPRTSSNLICECGTWTHALLVGGELGYGVTLFGMLTVRPQVGVGNATLMTSTSAAFGIPHSNYSEDQLYLEPGVTALVDIGSTFAGVDANAALFFDAPPEVSLRVVSAFTTHLQVGVKF